MRVGDWKLVRFGRRGAWELYDLLADRTEQHDLAAAEPQRVRELAAQWEAWAERAQVRPEPAAEPRKKQAKQQEPAASKETRFQLRPDADLKGDEAPDVAQRGFTVTVQLTFPFTGTIRAVLLELARE